MRKEDIAIELEVFQDTIIEETTRFNKNITDSRNYLLDTLTGKHKTETKAVTDKDIKTLMDAGFKDMPDYIDTTLAENHSDSLPIDVNKKVDIRPVMEYMGLNPDGMLPIMCNSNGEIMIDGADVHLDIIKGEAIFISNYGDLKINGKKMYQDAIRFQQENTGDKGTIDAEEEINYDRIVTPKNVIMENVYLSEDSRLMTRHGSKYEELEHLGDGVYTIPGSLAGTELNITLYVNDVIFMDDDAVSDETMFVRISSETVIEWFDMLEDEEEEEVVIEAREHYEDVMNNDLLIRESETVESDDFINVQREIFVRYFNEDEMDTLHERFMILVKSLKGVYKYDGFPQQDSHLAHRLSMGKTPLPMNHPLHGLEDNFNDDDDIPMNPHQHHAMQDNNGAWNPHQHQAGGHNLPMNHPLHGLEDNFNDDDDVPMNPHHQEGGHKLVKRYR